jgi:3-oxoacyl-[acyl-carrier-protein] synthase-3
MSVYLSAPRYELGETEVAYRDIPGLAERAKEWRMADLPDLWGWGYVRRTGRDVAELAVVAGRATVDAAGLGPGDVDALVVCCTRFAGGPETHGALVSEVMAGLGLPAAACLGLTLNRCTNLLAGIDVATALVAAGRYRRVLVVTADKAVDEPSRLEQFALFSDGAAACLVADAAHGRPGFEVLSCASVQDNKQLDWSHEISSDLARLVNDALLRPVGMAAGDVAALLHANLFLPVLVMKERQAGFTGEQLDTRNVARLGHCFAADPLINLADRVAAGRVTAGAVYLLAVSVPGVRHGVLLRAT